MMRCLFFSWVSGTACLLYDADYSLAQITGVMSLSDSVLFSIRQAQDQEHQWLVSQGYGKLLGSSVVIHVQSNQGLSSICYVTVKEHDSVQFRYSFHVLFFVYKITTFPESMF
jgi:hypothetical protein